jgi:hypothetical protein
MLASMRLPVLEHREVKLPKGLQSNINDVLKPFIFLKYKFPKKTQTIQSKNLKIANYSKMDLGREKNQVGGKFFKRKFLKGPKLKLL